MGTSRETARNGGQKSGLAFDVTAMSAIALGQVVRGARPELSVDIPWPGLGACDSVNPLIVGIFVGCSITPSKKHFLWRFARVKDGSLCRFFHCPYFVAAAIKSNLWLSWAFIPGFLGHL